MKVIALAVIAFLSGSAAIAQVGPGIQNPANGHIYSQMYVPSPLQEPLWEYYESLAQSSGGHLVTINDAEESQWLLDAFCAGGLCGTEYYIGLNDASDEGQFVWSSGEPVTFTNWAVGEPNNAFGNEDYVEMWSNGVWNDIGSPGDPNNINDALMERAFEVTIAYVGAPVPEEGSTVTFGVSAVMGNVGAVTYQWYKDGVMIPSATDSELSLSSISVADNGSYRCAVTDTSTFTVWSSSIALTVFPLASLTASGVVGLMTLALAICACLFFVRRYQTR